ncbi:MAG: cation:proton antiporter [Verrucomicrobia bacterium]|nr:cation:proton antiporter [Verrucomicrobiota bacterium]
MHSVAFLQDLAVVMIVAGWVTVICHRFKQPVVLGYIIAGVIIGPHTPPFPLIKDKEAIDTLAELGLVFLMFSLGLEFSLRKLRKVGFTALIAAGLEILLMVAVGYEIGRAFGWKTMDCVFLGAMLSISSTTIIVKALSDLGRSKEKFAELIFGILIVEDILAIVMIALLSGIAMTGSLAVGDLLNTTARLGIFLVVALVLGLLGVPRLIGYVARFKSNEMLLVTVLGLCFGVSLLAVRLHYSVALGAFVIGAVIAEAREIHRIEILTEPIRDMFSAVFFVAIGLLIDPKILAQHWLPVAVVTLAVVLGKVVTCAFGAFVAGNDTRTSLRVGMGLAQIGEFSFIIAALGLTLRVTSEFLYPIAVTVSVITTVLTPYLIKNSDRMVNWFDRVAPPRFVNYLALYTRWVGQWREGRHTTMTTRLTRRWTLQMGLNLALVAGIFIAATFVATKPPAWLPPMPGGREGLKALLWLGAALLSLPLLVATYRKLQALGLLLGEMAAQRLQNEPRAAGVQTVIANTVPLVGAICLGLLLLVLSTALLPSWRILIVLLLFVTAVTVLLRRNLVRVYSKAQFALEQTFAQPPPQRSEAAPLPGVLKEAQIETVAITANSPAKGKLIGELALRTQTGVSIVAIERTGGNIINPGPDEEIQANDQLLLLGRREQLEAARRRLLASS